MPRMLPTSGQPCSPRTTERGESGRLSVRSAHRTAMRWTVARLGENAAERVLAEATGKLPGNVAMVWSKFFSISVLEARQVQCQLILIESSTTKGETARPTAERLAVALPPPGLSATAASK